MAILVHDPPLRGCAKITSSEIGGAGVPQPDDR